MIPAFTAISQNEVAELSSGPSRGPQLLLDTAVTTALRLMASASVKSDCAAR